MIDSTTAATDINKLFKQLMKSILLYAVAQWLPYIHPRKVDKSGPIHTFSTLSSQLTTEDVWKRFIYPHYNLHESTPVLAVRAEFGSYPTFVAGISRLAKYMSYISQEEAPPSWFVKLSSPRRSWHPRTNSTGGPTHGESWINSRSKSPTPPISPQNVSKMRSVPNTVAGGFNTWLSLLTPLSSAPIGSLRPPSLPPLISTLVLITSAQLFCTLDVPTTDSILSSVGISMSPVRIDPVGSATNLN